MSSKNNQKSATKKINIALQGGGAHGAFTWGVLDKLLELECFVFHGISATSAGAMNAAIMLSGYMDDGFEGARKNLAKFWQMIGDMNPVSFLPHSPLENANPYVWNLHWQPSYNMVDSITRFYSPYEFNPMNYNPLRTVLESCINIERLNMCSAVRLFVSATRVSDGQPRIFECNEITIDVLMASACLPTLYQAVEIDGEHYWDGGYVGNPMLHPLMENCRDSDVLIVQINPVHRNQHPTGAREIIDRLNEITFNSSLVQELRQIEFINKLLKKSNYKSDRYKHVRLHIIEPHDEMLVLDASSKMNANYHFFEYLRDLGRVSAEKWIEKNFANIGKQSTLDIEKLFRERQLHTKAA